MAKADEEVVGKEKLGVPVPTFEAFDRATGEKIVVDHRTFDEELHSKQPVKVKKDPPKDPAK